MAIRPVRFSTSPSAQPEPSTPQASGGAGAAAGAGANHSDYAAAAPAAISANDYAHLPPLQRKVMEVVSAEEHDDGIHVSLVSRRCGTANGEEVM